MEKSRGTKEEEEQELTFLGFIKSLKIEPFFVLFTFAFAMRMTADQDLILERVCKKYFSNYTADSCRNESSTIQKSNNYKVYIDLIEFSPSILVSTLLGPWCDKYGRKFPCSIGIVGMMLHTCGLLIISLYDDLPTYLFFIAAVPAGITGGLITVMGNVYSLASEQSSKHKRTFRYALLELGKTLGFPLGAVAAGQIKRAGFVYIYGTTLLFLAFAFLWLNLIVKEKVRCPNATVFKKVKDFFDLSNLKESMHTCFKKREKHGKEQVLLLTLSICIGVLVLIGTKTNEYYYTIARFNWKLPHYSLVSAAFSFTGIVTTLLFTFFFTKKWPIKEPLIGLIGAGSTLGSTTVLAFAVKEWIFYLGSLINLLGSVSSLGARSLVSKLVEPHELGKIFAFIATCESLIPVAGIVIFTRIYNASLGFFPGLYLLVCAALTLISLAVFTWTLKLDFQQHKAQQSPSTQVLEVEMDEKSNQDGKF